MVAARNEFLAAGHYRAIADAVAAAAGRCRWRPADRDRLGHRLLPRGCRARLDQDGDEARAFGFDLSKAAATHAARQHPAIRFVVADVEAGVPLPGASVNAAISVFSPRPAAELGRVVRPGGELVVALAGPRHLERLRDLLQLMSIHDDKLARLSERLAPWFSPVQTETVEYEIELGAEDARRLVRRAPTPGTASTSAALAEGHNDLVSVVVARYRRDRLEPR